MGKAKEKFDHRKVEWVDTFNNEFIYIQNAVDLAIGACFADEDCEIKPESIGIILKPALEKLEKIHDLIDQVWVSVKSSQALSPEQQKQRKDLEAKKSIETMAAIRKIGEKFDKKLKPFERRRTL